MKTVSKTVHGILAGLLLATFFPVNLQAADQHLFYLHGCCIQDKDDPKVQAYQAIVNNLKQAGFQVSFNLRVVSVGDNDPAVQEHARQIAQDVRALLAKGVKPQHITVAGYSLGSMTAMVAAGHIANPDINVVLLAGCPVNSAIKVNIDYGKIRGRVLSIYDTKDVKFGSCQGRLPADVMFKEVVLNSGEGHAVFKMADDQHVNLWKEPLMSWVGEVRQAAGSASR